MYLYNNLSTFFEVSLYSNLAYGKFVALADGEGQVERDAIGVACVYGRNEKPVLDVLLVEVAREVDAPHVFAGALQREAALLPAVHVVVVFVETVEFVFHPGGRVCFEGLGGVLGTYVLEGQLGPVQVLFDLRRVK